VAPSPLPCYYKQSMKILNQTALGLLILIFFSCKTAGPAPVLKEEPHKIEEVEVSLPHASGSQGDSDSAAAGEEEPMPPPALTKDLLVKTALAELPPDMAPVLRDSGPWGIFHDLDKNGYTDYLLLVLEGVENPEHTHVDYLQDSLRLFDEDSSYLKFAVAIFYQYPDDVINRYNIFLGNKLVLQDFFFQEIRLGRDFPYTVAVTFQTLEGTEDEWIILQGRGISRFTLDYTLSKTSRIGDIDGDGLVDILVYQQGFEEGRGFETFITWFRWNGKDFVPHNRTNVMRNLRDFFTAAEEKIPSLGWERCFDRCLDLSQLADLRKAGKGGEEILSRFFQPLPGQEDVPPLFRLDPVGAVFPRVLEDPFYYSRGGPLRFSLIVKVDDRGGDSFFYQGLLGMADNPFGKNQFAFVMLEGD
jgi:hypothetical protein